MSVDGVNFSLEITDIILEVLQCKLSADITNFIVTTFISLLTLISSKPCHLKTLLKHLIAYPTKVLLYLIRSIGNDYYPLHGENKENSLKLRVFTTIYGVVLSKVIY